MVNISLTQSGKLDLPAKDGKYLTQSGKLDLPAKDGKYLTQSVRETVAPS
jgi:hypothetical protein